MKSTGVVRKLDKLGRIVIPIELRKCMGIAISDSMEIYTEGEQIILRKYAPGCVLCGEANDIVLHCGKRICRRCIAELTGKTAGKMAG